MVPTGGVLGSMEADAEPEEEPWELKLERALVSRLAPAPDDDEEEEEDAQIIAPNEEDRSAQLDELMALKSIFGDDLRGPAAAVAASMCAGDDDDDRVQLGGGERGRRRFESARRARRASVDAGVSAPRRAQAGEGRAVGGGRSRGTRQRTRF